MTVYDFAIVGAGMAGAALAAELAEHASVLLLEAEDRPGYHATGRSAAFWAETYGGPELVPLSLASRPYLREHGFLTQRGALYIGKADDVAELDGFMQRFDGSGAQIERVMRTFLDTRIPGLRKEWTSAIWEPDCADIDVAGLHAHYLGRGRANGVELRVRSRLAQAERSDGIWNLATEAGEHFRAATLVNAAGAWADRIAEIARVSPIGIQPFRRTVVQLRVSPTVPADMPLTLDIGGRFYFKPEAGRLWLSPHDEEPSEPCDAAPEEVAVAQAIARLEEVVDWRVEAVEHRWAGLRSFAPDRLPVYGFDPRAEGFYWSAGQGGSGIQTAPAAARMASQLLLGLEADAMTRDIEPTTYSPARLD